MSEGVLVLLSVAALEALLSGDNAMVLAVMVRPLPPALRRKALLYGVLGAYLLRGLALLFAVYLVQLWWVQVLGGLYLLYLMRQHFRDQGAKAPPRAQAHGFWRVVLLLNLVDLAFAVDSILAVVAFSQEFLWVFLGVALGVLFIRLLAGSVVAWMEGHPGLERVAYALVGWAGFKLLLEGENALAHLLHRADLAFHLPKPLFWAGTLLILLGGGFLALRRHA